MNYIVLDILCWLLFKIIQLKLWLSELFTVRCDPFNISHIPITDFRTNITFTVTSYSNERDRRIVSWFYRNHDAPNEDDWQCCLDRFNLQSCPPHNIMICTPENDLILKIVEIKLGVGQTHGSRNISLISSKGIQHLCSIIHLDGLSLMSLLKDTQES